MIAETLKFIRCSGRRLCAARNVLLRVVTLAVFYCFYCCASMYAQNITASVTGTVTDKSGGVVKGADISATNTATGITFPTKTNTDGIYSIQFLPPGPYTLTLSAAGYKETEISVFTLIGGQDARFDVPLAVGNASDTVTVTAMEPLLNTQDSTLSTTLNAKLISALPIVSDNVMTLGLLTPGAIQPSPQGFDNIAHSSGFSNPSFNVNGNREQSNNFTLDGLDVNDAIDNWMAYTPSRNSLAEFRMITGNNTAEYGNANGGQVVMTTKSGTNEFHGEGFFQGQTTDFNADSWLNKHSTTITARTPQNRAYFGGTLGGPILHGRLFFFVDYRGVRQHVTTTSRSYQPDPNYGNNAAYDMTGQASLKGTGTAYDPKLGAAVPLTNPAAIFLLQHPQLYPVCNQYNPGQTPGSGVGCATISSSNYIGYTTTNVAINQGDVKLDWKASDKDLVSGRYTQVSNVNNTPRIAMPVDTPVSGNYPYRGFVVNWTHQLGSSMVNEFRIGYGRTRYTIHPVDPTGLIGTNGLADIGVPGTTQIFPGIAQIKFAGTGPSITGFGPTNGGQASDSIVNAFTYGDKVEWQHGRHTFKFGGQALRYQENRFYTGNYGPLGTWTFTGAASSISSGSDYADFLEDKASTFYVGSNYGRWGERQWRPAFYFQDDFKLRPDFTVNLGLRWEYDQPMYEVHNHQDNINPYTGAISYAGVNGASRSLVNSYWEGFQPRIGFAYAPDSLHSRFVMRGGFAITQFMEGLGAGQRMVLNPPFTYNASGAAVTVPFAMSNGYPSISNNTPTTVAGNLIGWDPNFKPAFVQQYDLILAYQINNSTGIQLGYVGQVGHHIANLIGKNEAPCSIIALVAGGPTCNSPLATILPNLATHSVQYTQSEAMMNYNGLQASLTTHASHGLEYIANYTFSKAMGNSYGYYGSSTGVVSTASAYPQDGNNLAGDYGDIYFDARQLISFAVTYQLPIGRGQLIGRNWNHLVDSVLGGWKASMTGNYHTGFPESTTSTSYYQVNQGTTSVVRANQYRPLKIVHRSFNNWLGTDPSATPCKNTNYTTVPSPANPVMDQAASSNKIYNSNDNGVCAFGEELSTGFGTSHIADMRQPGYHDYDASASKAFAIPGGTMLIFRADAYNFINGVSWGSFQNSVSTTGTFGAFNSPYTNTTERHLQLALDVTF